MRKTTTAIALFLALCSSASAEIEEARDLMEAGQFEAAREALDAGVILEIYRSSAVSSAPGIADDNAALIEMGAFVELRPWYFAAWRLAEKHIAAPWHYFWSFQFDPPAVQDGAVPGLSASTPDADVRVLMGADVRLVHGPGRWTKTPEDDKLQARKR